MTLGSALLIGLIPFVALIALVFTLALGFVAAGAGGIPPALSIFAVLGIGGSFFFVGNLAVQGAMTRAMLGHAQGEPVTLRGCLAGSFGKIVPLFGLSLLMTVAIGVGLVFITVPGVILAVLWSVAAPALVAENLGVIAALRRSGALTKGRRWMIFGLMLFVGILCWMLLSALNIVSTSIGWTDGLARSLVGGLGVVVSIAGILFPLMLWTVCVAFWGAVSASLYLELRTAREGPLTNRLAEVFA